MADYRLLRKRLTAVPGPVSDETLRELARRAPLNQYHEPGGYVDGETGQHWIEVEYEAGFNQWAELVPVEPLDMPQR